MSTQLRNNPMKVALASMVGTAIEFFDYYIYAAAAVLVLIRNSSKAMIRFLMTYFLFLRLHLHFCAPYWFCIIWSLRR